MEQDDTVSITSAGAPYHPPTDNEVQAQQVEAEPDPNQEIEALLQREREAIENVPLVTTQNDAEPETAQSTLARLDLPDVGQPFTFDQDAAVFAAIYKAVQNEKSNLEAEGSTPEVDYVGEGSFLAWNGPDPFIRGLSDSFVRVGLIRFERDGQTYEKQLILDFNQEDVFFTDEVSVNTGVANEGVPDA